MLLFEVLCSTGSSNRFNSSPYFCLQQSTGDAPTTPKYSKEHRDLFFPASLPTPVLLSHSACHPLSTHDGQPRGPSEPLSKMARPQSSGIHDPPQQRRPGVQPAAVMAFLPSAGNSVLTQKGPDRRRVLGQLVQGNTK